MSSLAHLKPECNNLEPEERFINSLPERPYFTSNFNSGLHIRKKNLAIQFPYIQIAQQKRFYIPFDIDRENAAWEWEDVGLPPPTITIVNPENAHAHYLYELEKPVLFPFSNGTGNAREKPIKYYQAIKNAYALKLGADLRYRGLIVKNPLSKRWETIWRAKNYTLEELADYVDLGKSVKPWGRRLAIIEEIVPGTIIKGIRNDTLFKYGRNFAYGKVSTCHSCEELSTEVFLYCRNLNDLFVPPLSDSEVKAVSKSISKWTWKERNNFYDKKNRGVMGFSAMPSVMEVGKRSHEIRFRKQAGAKYAANKKRSRTEAEISNAIKKILAEGGKATIWKVSQEIGKSRAIIYKSYRHLFDMS